MKAVIMAGGRGSRLDPLTRNNPKPLLPLLDRPVMEYIVELLVQQGIRDIAVTISYLGEKIQEYFGDGHRWGARLVYQRDTQPLGTAGAVRLLDHFLDETFVVMSGDGLTDFNLKPALSRHVETGAWATLIVKEVKNPLGFGVIETDPSGAVRSFVEKPVSWDSQRSALINTGIYILSPRVLSVIPKGRPYDFGKDLFPALLQAGVPLYGVPGEGYWSDVGTLKQYYQTQLDMIQGRVQVRLPKVHSA